MTISTLRLSALLSSALLLTACQHLPDFLKPSSTASSTTTSSSTSASEPAQPVVPGTVAPVTAELLNSQNRWWERLRVGTLHCDLGADIRVDRLDMEREVAITWKKKSYLLHKVSTSTGAYRYEDPSTGLTLIQIPTKTILLDARQGQRLADECNIDRQASAAPVAEPVRNKKSASSRKAKSTTKTAKNQATSKKSP
jgi:hypothetical protein